MKTKLSTLLLIAITTAVTLLTSCEPSPGKVTFWVQNDFGTGTIEVTVVGYTTKSISSYYISGISGSGCGPSGCATYSIPPGSYSYSALATGSTLTWSGSCTVTENGCLQVKLTN